MALGRSFAEVTGNVGEPIVFGQTRGNARVAPAECCSFFVAVQETLTSKETWVKINVYQLELVADCHERIKKGVFITARGKFMNRPNRSDPEAPKSDSDGNRPTLEIRCSEIVFHTRREEGD